MEESLAVKYLEYLDLKDNIMGGLGNTFNDFFDWAGIPMRNRTDFAVAAILKQVQEIWEANNDQESS